MISQTELGARIKFLREKTGYSQEFLAEELGLSRQAIINIEGGKRKIDSFELFELCRLFGIQAQELLEEQKVESLNQSLIHCRGKVNEEGKKSIREFQQILDDYDFLKGLFR